MSDEWEATHHVSDEMQRAFVQASGDANPLHTDPIVARRLPFGRVAVHGMHLALDALDRLASHISHRPQRVRCTFRRSVGVDDRLVTRIATVSDLEARITIDHDVWRVADLRIDLAPSSSPSTASGNHGDGPGVGRLTRRADAPVDLPVSALPGLDGAIDVAADVPELRRRFPHLVGALGALGTAELVSLTRLVGMHVPGRHSLFSSFDVQLNPVAPRPATMPAHLGYAVTRFDDRFAKATIDVDGPTLSGTVVAFVRPAPVQPTVGSARPRSDEFTGQRWLVIGGSRGLGATASMLLAAGGADVRLTYRIGADDAERLSTTIGAAAHRLDVTDPQDDMTSLLADGWHPTHLAYFASPPIFVGSAGAYSTELERRFAAVYLDGFDAVLENLPVEHLRGVLWPSSEAVDDDVPGLSEYAAAKRRGEARCAALAREHPDMTVATPRFPRLRTDQTASYLPVDYDDAPTTVLAALRVFSG